MRSSSRVPAARSCRSTHGTTCWTSPSRLQLPVLLVVGMRLGCLNHALLTVLAVRRRGLVLRGWIANELPPGMPHGRRNIGALTERIGVAPIVVVAPDAVPSFDADALAMLGFAGERIAFRANI